MYLLPPSWLEVNRLFESVACQLTCRAVVAVPTAIGTSDILIVSGQWFDKQKYLCNEISFFCRQNFKNVGALVEQGARVGHIAVLEHEGRYIYYLVTKKYSTEKPRLEDLFSSLEKMRDHCAEHGVKYLAMPRIGCGLDRLEWKDVKPKIEEVFSRLDISITIYNFNQVN